MGIKVYKIKSVFLVSGIMLLRNNFIVQNTGDGCQFHITLTSALLSQLCNN